MNQRFATVAAADLIIVLDRGRIVERGSHTELPGARGHYAEPYDLQARGYHRNPGKGVIMTRTDQLTTVLTNWTTLLGQHPALGREDTGRELWPVTAEDGRQYFLKLVSPWRNLPVADEARVLRWFSRGGIDVAEFLITDQAGITADDGEDTFVLIPLLESDQLEATETVGMEDAVGQSIAELHRALAAYPWPANSYVEDLTGALRGELLLPDDVAEAFAARRDSMAAALGALPLQLVHGDLTPDNVLLRRPARVSGFIDFDHLPLAPRVWDLGKHLSRRMRMRRQPSRASTPQRVQSIHGLVGGYHRQRPLSEAELDALPAAIAAGNIIEADYGQRISSGLLERRKLADHDEVLADAIEAARWQLANERAVVDAVRVGAAGSSRGR